MSRYEPIDPAPEQRGTYRSTTVPVHCITSTMGRVNHQCCCYRTRMCGIYGRHFHWVVTACIRTPSARSPRGRQKTDQSIDIHDSGHRMSIVDGISPGEGVTGVIRMKLGASGSSPPDTAVVLHAISTSDPRHVRAAMVLTTVTTSSRQEQGSVTPRPLFSAPLETFCNSCCIVAKSGGGLFRHATVAGTAAPNSSCCNRRSSYSAGIGQAMPAAAVAFTYS